MVVFTQTMQVPLAGLEAVVEQIPAQRGRVHLVKVLLDITAQPTKAVAAEALARRQQV